MPFKNKEKEKEWRRARSKTEAQKERGRKYAEKNRAHLLEYMKEWGKRNKERKAEYNKMYVESNREKVRKTRREWNRKRRNEDPLYKFIGNVRGLINHSFRRVGKNLKKIQKTEEILGCSVEEFKDYILEKCPCGVELKDFGKRGYHIDHIIPISRAETEEDVIRLCHYTNLQPLFYIDNIKKSNKT